MNESEELLEITDKDGRVIGIARRSEIHGNPSLIHRVVHVLVLNERGEILLQRRSMNKDVAPGRWDTSVGGHINPKESPHDAAMREMQEELGVSARADYLYSYTHSNPYETELVYTFITQNEGPFSFNKEEIDEVRFWSVNEIKQNLGKGILSDNFEDEFDAYIKKTLQTPLS